MNPVIFGPVAPDYYAKWHALRARERRAFAAAETAARLFPGSVRSAAAGAIWKRAAARLAEHERTF